MVDLVGVETIIFIPGLQIKKLFKVEKSIKRVHIFEGCRTKFDFWEKILTQPCYWMHNGYKNAGPPRFWESEFLLRHSTVGYRSLLKHNILLFI